jgi:hypothetical protein
MTVVIHQTGSPAPTPQDITCEEAGLWVAEEFFAIKDDLFEVNERIGRERATISGDGYQSGQFPNANFAHEALLVHLEARYLVLLGDAVGSDRTLH